MIRKRNIVAASKGKARQLLSFCFIVLFIYVAASQIKRFEEFHLRLERFPFLSEYAELIAYAVPAIQIFIALLFLSLRFEKAAFYVSFILMLTFTLYLFFVITFAQNIPCSCEGVIPSFSWNHQLYFNLGFTVLALLGIFLSNSKNAIQAKVMKS